MGANWYEAFTIVGIRITITCDENEIKNIKKLFKLFDRIYVKNNELEVIPYMPSIHDRMQIIQSSFELLELTQYAIGIKLYNRSKLVDVTSAFEKVRLYAEQHLDKFSEAGFDVDKEPVLLSASDWASVVDEILEEEDSEYEFSEEEDEEDEGDESDSEDHEKN
jgi:hypothetical protein